MYMCAQHALHTLSHTVLHIPQDCQTLMHKLKGEKHRQMEAVKAKIEERRLRKERAASKSPASMSTTFSLEKEPRLKQLIIKYRWEIKMESIR